MSERTFFTLRYALPGYTYILMIVLVAYPTLENVLAQFEDITLVAAFLAFLSLLSGGALGFLVSQVWYVVFNLKICGKYGKLPETMNLLADRYKLTKDKHHRIVFLDYIHRLSNDKMQIYAQRRYDLMHICGSTLIATIIGSFSGILIRSDLLRAIKIEFSDLDILSIIVMVILTILLGLSLWHICKEHAMAIDISVREAIMSKKASPSKVKKCFSDDYFDNKIK